MLSITVDTLVDTNVFDLSDGVSLREAVQMANTTAGLDTIDFSVNGTITLTEGELLVSEGLSINGPGRDNVTIDAAQNSRLFRFADGAAGGDLTLSGLSLINGRVNGGGGAVLFESSGTLTIADSRVSGNSTLGSDNAGGAFFAGNGDIAISGSEVSENSTIGDYAPGGAVATGGNLTISNSTITGNSTAGFDSPGGAVYALGDADTSVEVTNSTLTSNSTDSGNYLNYTGLGGGAIATTDASVVVTGSDVSGNSVVARPGSGGGIASDTGAITIRQSTINNNTLDNPATATAQRTPGGAGLASSSGDILIEDSTVSGNTNNSIGALGGGVFAGSGSVTVRRSTIVGNRTTNYLSAGGGIQASYGDVTVTDSTISGNSTSAEIAPGGGISLDTGNLVLSNSTVSGNNTTGSLSRGAGVYNRTGNVTIRNSTITGNSITGGTGGGGVHVVGDAFGSRELNIFNSVVAGNSSSATGADSGNDIVVDTSTSQPPTVDIRFSLVGDNTGTMLVASATPDANGNLIGGAGASVIDPLLSALADNGGPTLTHLPGAVSPLIDAGDPAFDPNAPGSPSTDQRGAGFARVAGGRLDIGAVEVPSDGGPGLLGDYNNDTVVNAADFVVWRDTVDSPASAFPTVDGDDSGTIDAGDYDVWAENFGRSSGSQAVAAAAASPVESASLLAAVPTNAAAGYTPKTAKTATSTLTQTPPSATAVDALQLLYDSNIIGEPARDSAPPQTGPEAESDTSNDLAAEEAFAQLAVVL